MISVDWETHRTCRDPKHSGVNILPKSAFRPGRGVCLKCEHRARRDRYRAQNPKGPSHAALLEHRQKMREKARQLGKLYCARCDTIMGVHAFWPSQVQRGGQGYCKFCESMRHMHQHYARKKERHGHVDTHRDMSLAGGEKQALVPGKQEGLRNEEVKS